MALITSVRVNEGPNIANLICIRRTNPGRPKPDDISQYECYIIDYDLLEETTHVLISHRYGDGAWGLVSKALSALGYS